MLTETGTTGSYAQPELPDILSGFEHINRYWDKRHLFHAVKILPGEYYVTLHDEGIITVLGSCVSACIRCRVTGVGGMNHFMLPEVGHTTDTVWTRCGNDAATRYGSYAMEHMINDILRYGGSWQDLEIKITGGGRILQNMITDIGKQNIDFVRQYIATEGLTISREDVGDIYPRKVQYFPKTGRLRIKKLRSLHNDTIIKREETYKHEIEDKPFDGGVELF
ncbi:MAG: chemoreceptor glutamine deamidase CheD [Gammaproteobacteria bacterium]